MATYTSLYTALYGSVYPGGYISSYAPGVYPVPLRFINLGKESQPGSVAASTYTLPCTTFKAADSFAYAEDQAWRPAMAGFYGLAQGVRIARVAVGGPLYADGIGYPLTSILGDYWQAVAGGTAAASSSLSSPSAVGAGTIVVSSGAGFSASELISVGAAGSTAEEVREITNVSGGTLTLSSALYQAHATGGTVIAYSSFTGVIHNFSVLNSGLGAGGAVAGQPPTYSYVDYTGVPAGTGARTYAYSCFDEVSVISEAAALTAWEGKITALASQISASAPAAMLTGVKPQAAWNTSLSIAGAGTLNNAECKFTLSRKSGPKYAHSGKQDPSVIARGPVRALLSVSFDPASNESELLYYLENAQPPLQVVASNGLTGMAAASVTISAQTGAFDSAQVSDTRDTFGYDATVSCVAQQVNAGPSGGASPVVVSLQNQVISY